MPDRDLSGHTLGEFILREQIGKGGYGAVYRGEQLLLERDVVVKVLHERRGDDVSRRRFLREAKLASRLDHPYAAHIYAFGAEPQDGIQWLAMELVQGVPLDDWLEARGPMPLEQFVPFFDCVAQVVHAAHERGIVHRDLKPSNIMVIERGDRLFPKLLDFGIAKVHSPEAAPPAPASWPDASLAGDCDSAAAPNLASAPDPDDVETARLRVRPPRTQRARTESGRRLTPSGACVGSRPYMAPEQWSNAEDAGPAADIYSLGIVAYEALTGRVPFTANSTGEYFRLHCHALPPMLLWSEVDNVLQTALAKYPNSRQRSVLEMASALRRALRVSRREQLRSSAQQWEDQDRAPGLLWGPDVLEDITRRLPPELLGDLECSFVVASLRRARRIRWVWRALVALAAAAVLAGIGCWAVLQTRLAEQQARMAQQVAEVTATQAELEQGRSALLLNNEPEAQLHLIEAYRRDHSPPTAFMLARALQPRLAERAHFASSFGRMWSALFSPDGRQIVTTDDKNVQVRDAQTGRLLFTLPHGNTVYQAVYSADGTRLVTTGGDGAIRIWNTVSSALVRELRHGSAKPRYYAVAMSPDGKLVAAIDSKGEIAHVWDSATGSPIAEIRNDASEFPAIAFSSDGRWLATTGGNDVRVFDARTRMQATTIRGPRVRSLAFDPTGPRLLTGAATGDVAIWAIPGGARIRHLREVGDPVEAVAFSPDGQLVAAGSRDGAEQVWHASSGELQSQFNPRRSKILSLNSIEPPGSCWPPSPTERSSSRMPHWGYQSRCSRGRRVFQESPISTRARAASSEHPEMARPGYGMRLRRIAAGARHRSPTTAV